MWAALRFVVCSVLSVSEAAIGRLIGAIEKVSGIYVAKYVAVLHSLPSFVLCHVMVLLL